jgi:hypothetical protein
MKSAAVMLFALLPLGAQMASRAVPSPSPTVGGTPAAKVKIPISTLYLIERNCDDKLRGLGEPSTVDLLGATRGVYLDGYGTVFTTEIGLVSPPAIYPFHPKITDDEKVQQHKRKLQRMPILKTAMKDMMKAAAAGLSAMPDTQQIVFVVRLDNAKWEDTTGLPSMVLVRADRKSALAGIFQIEEE